MAKRKVNKSEKIRAVLNDGIEKPQEVVAELEKRGVSGVDAKTVSVVKNKWKKTKGNGRTGKRGRRKGATTRAASNGDVIGAVLNLAKLARQHTVAKLRQWLDRLED